MTAAMPRLRRSRWRAWRAAASTRLTLLARNRLGRRSSSECRFSLHRHLCRTLRRSDHPSGAARKNPGPTLQREKAANNPTRIVPGTRPCHEAWDKDHSQLARSRSAPLRHHADVSRLRRCGSAFGRTPTGDPTALPLWASPYTGRPSQTSTTVWPPSCMMDGIY